MNNPTTAQEAVANGAQMLDEKVPGWHRLINLDSLELNSCEKCVCGQLGRQLGWNLFPDMDDYPWEYGFEMLHPEWDYNDLDVEWQKAIKARLELDKRPVPAEEKEEAIA